MRKGNPSYRKGRAFEYKVKKILEKAGVYVIRSAGSHSHFDLVAFSEKECILFQCKLRYSKIQRYEKIKFKQYLVYSEDGMICFEKLE